MLSEEGENILSLFNDCRHFNDRWSSAPPVAPSVYLLPTKISTVTMVVASSEELSENLCATFLLFKISAG